MIGAAALDSDDYLIFDLTACELFYDPGGCGAQGGPLVARLAGVSSLSEADLIIL